MKKMAIILASTLALSATAQAVDTAYFELGNPEVTLVKTEKLNPRAFAAVAIGSELCQEPNSRFLARTNRTFSVAGEAIASEILAPLDAAEMILDKVTNLGKKIWDLVAKGQPVVNLRTDVATALPYGAKCWLDLQTWRAPIAKTYSVSYKNLYGVEVVKFTYRIVFVSGGSVNGKGAYIGYAALEPSDVSVAWGFTFNAQAAAPTIYNMGTKEDPVAGMNLQMNYTIDTVLKHVEASQSYFVNGNGEFQKLD